MAYLNSSLSLRHGITLETSVAFRLCSLNHSKLAAKAHSTAIIYRLEKTTGIYWIPSKRLPHSQEMTLLRRDLDPYAEAL